MLDQIKPKEVFFALIVSQEGYIAMLVVDKAYRKLKIGRYEPLTDDNNYSKLVSAFIEECRNCGGDEVVLETEVVNIPALKLYESINTTIFV